MSRSGELQAKINAGRVFNIAAAEIRPLVEERRLRSVEELIAQYRNGHTNLLTYVAKVEAYASILEDIQGKQLEFEHLLDKHNKEK